MKVLLFGHSYVRNLERLGNWDREIQLNTSDKINCNFYFKSFPGKDYEFLVDHPHEVDKIQLIDPDIIIVILGGNSVTNKYTNIQINELAFKFYTKLKSVVRPDCIILPVQIEPRFVGPNNIHGTPTAIGFNRRRNVLNNYVNKQLKKKGLINRIILLGSVNFLGNPNLFTDGVHLSREGLNKYRNTLFGGIRYALENK